MKSHDPQVLARDLARLMGDDAVRLPQGPEASAARLLIEPRDATEVAEIVRKCEAEQITLAPIGASRTLPLLRRVPADLGVALTRMNRIIDYEPDDMTVIAEAGLTLGALNQVLGQHRQHLPADPADPAATTLGAMVAAAHAGPIRLSEGTVRDLLIGVSFAGHGGRLVHGGGRVVKNVAGYDLMKVMTGAFGSLGIIVEATFKVRPTPENYSLAMASFADAATAFECASAAASAAPLIHLEVLSPAISARLNFAASFSVIAGYGGSRAEITYQREHIAAALGAKVEMSEGAEAEAIYVKLRDLDFSDGAAAAQIAVPPAELARCLAGCGGAEFRAHAGCGVAQLLLNGPECTEAEIREAIAHWRSAAHALRGNLRVLAMRADARDGVAVFDEPPAPAMALMRRLKATFDPCGVFNPGCFVGGL